MSIKTNELQQLTSVLGTDSVLLDSAAGTGRLSLEALARYLTEQDNAVSAALANKAALSAQETVELAEVPNRHVPLAASELQSYIDALPRLLTEDLYLEPSGELDTAVEVKDFYGPGNLAIVGGGDFTLRNTPHIMDCSVFIYVHSIEFQERAGTSGVSGIMVSVERSSHVQIYNCGFTGLGAESVMRAVAAQFTSGIYASKIRITGCSTAILSKDSSIVSIGNNDSGNTSTFSGNAIGGYVAYGGIILLGGSIPNTLGGSTNGKYGGIIASSNGTLL